KQRCRRITSFSYFFLFKGSVFCFSPDNLIKFVKQNRPEGDQQNARHGSPSQRGGIGYVLQPGQVCQEKLQNNGKDDGSQHGFVLEDRSRKDRLRSQSHTERISQLDKTQQGKYHGLLRNGVVTIACGPLLKQQGTGSHEPARKQYLP